MKCAELCVELFVWFYWQINKLIDYISWESAKSMMELYGYSSKNPSTKNVSPSYSYM